MNVKSNDIIAIAMIRVSRQFFNLRNAKPKPKSLYARDFSRALHVACDCRELLFVYPHCLLLIGRSNNFDIGFTIVIRKPPYTPFGCIALCTLWLAVLPKSKWLACARSRFGQSNGYLPTLGMHLYQKFLIFRLGWLWGYYFCLFEARDRRRLL